MESGLKLNAVANEVRDIVLAVTDHCLIPVFISGFQESVITALGNALVNPVVTINVCVDTPPIAITYTITGSLLMTGIYYIMKVHLIIKSARPLPKSKFTKCIHRNHFICHTLGGTTAAAAQAVATSALTSNLANALSANANIVSTAGSVAVTAQGTPTINVIPATAAPVAVGVKAKGKGKGKAKGKGKHKAKSSF